MNEIPQAMVDAAIDTFQGSGTIRGAMEAAGVPELLACVKVARRCHRFLMDGDDIPRGAELRAAMNDALAEDLGRALDALDAKVPR